VIAATIQSEAKVEQHIYTWVANINRLLDKEHCFLLAPLSQPNKPELVKRLWQGWVLINELQKKTLCLS
jgi:hypothetical protein